MGYYIWATGTISFKPEDEPSIVEALKRLNYRHDLKRNGVYPKTGDVWKDTWFAWMPSEYHNDTSITTVAQIIATLGYNVEPAVIPEHEWKYREGETVLAIEADTKLGDEAFFFAVMAQEGCTIDLWVSGEDDNWQWRSSGEKGTALEEWSRPQEYVCVHEMIIELPELADAE
jgi:hypothetical protein